MNKPEINKYYVPSIYHTTPKTGRDYIPYSNQKIGGYGKTEEYIFEDITYVSYNKPRNDLEIIYVIQNYPWLSWFIINGTLSRDYNSIYTMTYNDTDCNNCINNNLNNVTDCNIISATLIKTIDLCFPSNNKCINYFLSVTKNNYCNITQIQEILVDIPTIIITDYSKEYYLIIFLSLFAVLLIIICIIKVREIHQIHERQPIQQNNYQLNYT